MGHATNLPNTEELQTGHTDPAMLGSTAHAWTHMPLLSKATQAAGATGDFRHKHLYIYICVDTYICSSMPSTASKENASKLNSRVQGCEHGDAALDPMGLVNVTDDLDGHDKVGRMSGCGQHSLPGGDFVTWALIVLELANLGLFLTSAQVLDCSPMPTCGQRSHAMKPGCTSTSAGIDKTT